MKKINLICFCILFFLSSCDFMPNGDSVTLDKDLPITVQPEDFDERDIEDEDDSDEKKEMTSPEICVPAHMSCSLYFWP